MSENQSENVKSFPHTLEGEMACIRYFVSITPFMTFEELDSWLTNPEWMENINMEVVKMLADVCITKEFYILLKACYENNTDKNTLMRLGNLLVKDGIKLYKDGNTIYQHPMKRLQDAYYILGYIVQIRMKKCKTINKSNLFSVKVNMPGNLNYAWDGIGGWMC